MKIKIYILILLLVAFSSCKKWLDVPPEDRFTEKQTFSNTAGFSDAINGVYIQLSDSKLYGANLTFTTLEILAQRYNISNSLHENYTVATYNYTDAYAMKVIDDIWKNMYVSITNINKFIANLNTYSANIDNKTASLFRGEAYGLRALLYLDLLRMYGPVYSTDPAKPCIPYYDKAGNNISIFYPASFIMDKIIEDLRIAEELLISSDPIIQDGVVVNALLPAYFSFRNRRMNYYAVKGLQARAYLWKGDKPNALLAAKTVIAAQEKFPWITSAEINNIQNPDRIFSKEVIFGVFSAELYNNYNRYFNPLQDDRKILAPAAAYLTTVFEGKVNDFRYLPLWILPSTGKDYRTFYKYADVIDPGYYFRNTISVLRISEVFYIAAECEPDQATAFGYLNTVLNKREQPSLPQTATLNSEILKEYRKEFYGEGCLWYYYKRNNIKSIAAGNGTTKTVSELQYVFPVPLSETNPR